MNEINKRKASAEARAVWLRNYQRARGRALVRLAKQYPDQYKELFEQERLSDEASGKAWSNLSGGHSPTEDSNGLSSGSGSLSEQHTN